jgi:hypothetical protein
MLNLNAFLVLIQRGQFFSPVGAEVLFAAFNDLAFNLGHQCIQLYYRTFAAIAQLTDAQKCCNAAMRSECITIEKKICNGKQPITHLCGEGWVQTCKKKPYAIKQLHVCTLLTNCYICLNGDTVGSNNTFGLNPPRLSEYLSL